MVDRPDVLLSLTTNRFGAVWILAAGVRGFSLGVRAGISFRRDLWGKRGDDPYGVRVAEGIGCHTRLIPVLRLDWHDLGST